MGRARDGAGSWGRSVWAGRETTSSLHQLAPEDQGGLHPGGGAPGSLYGPVGGMRGRSSHSPKLPTRDADITSITLRGAQTGTPQAPGFLLVMDQVLGSERGLEGGHLQERSARPGLGWVAGPEAAAGWPSWSDKKMRLALVIP